MELNHWYKGTELPDAECDCVVVYGYGEESQKGLAHVSFHKSGQIQINIKLLGSLNPYALKAWMPIEYPKEVSE